MTQRDSPPEQGGYDEFERMTRIANAIIEADIRKRAGSERFRGQETSADVCLAHGFLKYARSAIEGSDAVRLRIIQFALQKFPTGWDEYGYYTEWKEQLDKALEPFPSAPAVVEQSNLHPVMEQAIKGFIPPVALAPRPLSDDAAFGGPCNAWFNEKTGGFAAPTSKGLYIGNINAGWDALQKIQADTIERCAKLADEFESHVSMAYDNQGGDDCRGVAAEIAREIRAMNARTP